MISRQPVIYQRGGQREGSPHCLILHSDEDSTDEDIVALININQSTSRRRKIKVLHLQVKPDDTLQALALRYGCTISELKRINKIDKENEIYAKPYIKVPIQPFSVLTETLTCQEGCNANAAVTQHKEERSAEKEEQLIDLNVIPIRTKSSNTEINKVILNSVREPLSSYNSTDEVPFNENDRLLTNAQSTVTDSQTDPIDIFNCSGDDWGLSWIQIFLCTFLLFFVIPIIFIYRSHITRYVKDVTAIE